MASLYITVSFEDDAGVRYRIHEQGTEVCEEWLAGITNLPASSHKARLDALQVRFAEVFQRFGNDSRMEDMVNEFKNHLN